MRAAALVIDRAGARGEPANQRPARNFRLRDETHDALAVHQFDIQPRHVIGDEQYRAGQRLADAMNAETETAHQQFRPPALRDVRRQFAVNLHPIGEWIEHGQRQRKRYDREQ